MSCDVASVIWGKLSDRIANWVNPYDPLSSDERELYETLTRYLLCSAAIVSVTEKESAS